jgi:Xaa-Pro aminopeptidase
MLTYDEISWIEIYHAKVAEALMPLVDNATGAWLAAAILPLGHEQAEG